MKKETILITGAGPNGITGNRIKEGLANDYNILHPNRLELDLTDTEAVNNYFDNHTIDIVIHCAVIYPTENTDGFAENVKMYFNLARNKDKFIKMFYLGSGAEYDKTHDIINASEYEIGNHIPKDPYGLCKFILQEHTEDSDNIYNIRLFGTINPQEPYTKNVISNLCMKAAKKIPLSLRRNCRFSFTDIDDVTEFLRYSISNELKFHSYNFVPEKNYLLSEIAEIICKVANINTNISFMEKGVNPEYTGSSKRIAMEFNQFTPLSKSLAKVYERMVSIADTVEVNKIDERWKK